MRLADRRGESPGVARDVLLGCIGAGRTDFLRFGAQVIGIAHFLPFVQQTGIHLANHRSEVKFHLAHRLVLGRVGHRLRQHLEDAIQMAQQNPFGPLQFVVADIIGKRTERLEHLPRDGLGPDVFLAHPRMPRPRSH